MYFQLIYEDHRLHKAKPVKMRNRDFKIDVYGKPQTANFKSHLKVRPTVSTAKRSSFVLQF